MSCVSIYVTVIPNKTLDEAINQAIQLETIYEAEDGSRKQSKHPLRLQRVTPDEFTAGDRLTAMLTITALENMV